MDHYDLTEYKLKLRFDQDIYYALSFSNDSEDEVGTSSIVLTGPMNHFLAENIQLKEANMNTPMIITTE